MSVLFNDMRGGERRLVSVRSSSQLVLEKEGLSPRYVSMSKNKLILELKGQRADCENFLVVAGRPRSGDKSII